MKLSRMDSKSQWRLEITESNQQIGHAGSPELDRLAERLGNRLRPGPP